jgi:hypothetical protein
MQGSKKFKLVLLDSMLLGLHERKRAIKLAADAALVNARSAEATCWSRTMQAAPELALRPQITRGAKSLALASRKRNLRKRCHRLRCPRKAGSAGACGSAGVLARAMVRKRTRVLKAIVPGGEELNDECTLLAETLDYAVCLRAQVDVMQLLVRALQAAKP